MMESSKSNYLIPGNIKGKETDVEEIRKAGNRQEAVRIFKEACERMFNVNAWHELSGFASAHFTLKDSHGNDSDSVAKVGDYIQIDIPGPGPSSGDGYDWVQVELIDDHRDASAEEESMGMRVRSSKNPNNEDNEIAHFFTGNATSVFIIHRKNNTVTSSYHGRNEVLNTDTGKLKDTIRNTITGLGAFIGISELQWSRLIKSFIEKSD